jgi:putative transposase
MHGQTLWQCDFFSKRILSRIGMPQVYALVFIQIATRKVWISTSTKKPTGAWVFQQTTKFLDFTAEQGLPVKEVCRDNDYNYHWFDDVLAARGVSSRRLALRAPNTNAYVERFIQTLQVECLDHFLVFGEKHLDHLVREYVEHYHSERPHQGLDNQLVVGESPPGEGEVACKTRLGGLLKHYYRAAA